MMFGIQWCIKIGERYCIVLYIFFPFAPHNCYTHLMPKATISIVVCCEHNLEIKAEVFELCSSCTLCHDMHRIKYFCCIAVCCISGITAVTLQYDYT